MSEYKIPVPAEGPRKRNVFDVIDAVKSSDDRSILIRVDFNVPMDGDLNITDDSRIKGALPTIKSVISAGCNAVIVSHMGRPKLVQKGGDDAETLAQKKALSLAPAAKRLGELLGKEVEFASDCVGSVAQDAVSKLPSAGGGVVVLENLRFYKAEEKNEADFVKQLSDLANGYVNDAFGTCHRAHASTAGVPKIKEKTLCGIGILVASELNFLDFSHLSPSDHVTAIIGGSKVSTKLPVIEGLLGRVNTLILGGGLAYTFVKSKGINIGDSLLEESMIEIADGLLKKAKESGKKIVIPVDSVCTTAFPKGPMDIKDTTTYELIEGSGIPDGHMGLDIGPKSVKQIEEALKGSTKVVFNGPMGVFEIPPFDTGTRGLVDSLEVITKEGTITVVGGGDSVAAVEQFGKSEAVTYISTGGGASLELLAGDILPGVAAIADFE